MSLKWFNTTTEGGVDTTSYTGNFKVIGDIEVTGLVRRNGEIFESITPQWSNTTTQGKIYFNIENTPIFVGIGTSNPTRTLDVKGDIAYTGELVRNGQILNFGLAAWNGDKSGTIFYGGNDNNRIGVGEGFGFVGGTQTPIPARASIHAWSLSTYNSNIPTETWNPNMGIRVGPHAVNKPFLQMGVMENTSVGLQDVIRNWSWMQSARYSDNTITPSSSRLLINPKGGNVGIGVNDPFHVDSSLAISSFGEFDSQNGFRKAISLAPETHESTSAGGNYNSIIYSKNFGLGFVDQDVGGGFYIMTNSGSQSFRLQDWERSVQMCVRNDGNVGIGTASPILKLTVSSSSSNGILISNPNITQFRVGEGTPQAISGFGIQMNIDDSDSFPITDGLGIGPLSLGNTTITNTLMVTDTGIRVNPRVEATQYAIGQNVVLQANTLGSTITNSSLTSLGTLTSLNVAGPSNISNTLNVTNSITAPSYRIGSNTVLSAGQLGFSITASNLTSVGALVGLTVAGQTNLNSGVSVGGSLTVGGNLSVGGVFNSASQTVEFGSNEGPFYALRNTLKTSNTQVRTWRIWNMTGIYGDSLQFWRYIGTSETPSGSSLTLLDDGDVKVERDLRVQNRLRIGNMSIEVEGAGLFIRHDDFTSPPGRYALFVPPDGNSTAQWGNGSGRPRYFSVTSDERLKRNIHILSSSDMLQRILNLSPIEFEYIDSDYANGMKYGFKAQDVAKFIPQAVSVNEGSLFTIDCIADVLENRYELLLRSNPKNPINVGDVIIIIVGDGNSYKMKTEITDINNSIITISKPIPSCFTYVHVHGHFAEDINSLEYTVITAANTSAIQELTKQLNNANKKIDMLENEIIEIKRLLSQKD
jgi:hypothetical protein